MPINEVTDEQHYQPWLRNQGDAAPVVRPGALPSRGPAAGVQAVPSSPPPEVPRPVHAMSADELLARPLRLPADEAPDAQTLGMRARAEAEKFGERIGGWAGVAVRRADLPSRVHNMAIGRRARTAGAKAKRLTETGAAAAGASLRRFGAWLTDIASRAVAVGGPWMETSANAVRGAMSRGLTASKAVGRTAVQESASGVRRVLASSPIARLIPEKSAPPESQLDRLMVEDAAHSRATISVDAALPLFAAAQPAGASAAVEQSTGAPSAVSSPPDRPPLAPDHRGPTHGGGGSGSPSNMEWLRHPASWVVGGLALVMSGFVGGMMWSGGNGGRAVTERIVHDYLLNHPEIIPQAMERLQARRVAAAIGRQRSAIERAFSGAWAGAADGDVTLVVFTDYACTYCRASEADITRLLQEDRRLKIVFRELPILSRESEAAARLALLAARSGRYLGVHRALFANGNPDAAARADVAERFVIEAEAAALDNPAITNELRANVALAQDLGFDGTPSWVVGDKVLTGAVGYDALKAAIAEARGS